MASVYRTPSFVDMVVNTEAIDGIAAPKEGEWLFVSLASRERCERSSGSYRFARFVAARAQKPPPPRAW
ncbi:hypothetical protein RB2378 [Rhodopirellula baltica SH 1]|uniref:Uncharacterized protein n=1 Tax=Rhodopirellula baltica (strain DSM 10527 / NCIMB 13988 / SH1) TaxID=243090 RepID=Q7UVX6_RHOBA|nr:hypothetical protein RB2378 [Rhodopirellula baltica SH 1]